MNKVAITKQTYDKLAKIWSDKPSNSFFHEKQFRIFAKLLKAGSKVADIGCANGIHLPLFFGIGSHLKYEGFDFSKSMLKIAKSRYPNIPFNYLDISDPKTLPKKKYDAFWASAVLMHVSEDKWDVMFANLEKMTKPKGIGYITIPEQKPIIMSSRDQRHFTLKTSSEFETIVKARGWKVLKKAGMLGNNNIPWNWFIVRLP